MILQLTRKQEKQYSDADVVSGLQSKSRSVENWFFSQSEKYFNQHFNDIFFDQDRKQEIFQTAFLKIWTEISNGKITVLNANDDANVNANDDVNDDVNKAVICRQQRNGEYKPMTCSLTTFLMTFAKMEFREFVRTNKLDTYAEVYDNVDTSSMVVTSFDTAEDIAGQKTRIVDDCISDMSPRCTEVLTLFYLEGKSLDEIMEIRKEKNSSKNGLKTAKNKCMNTLREKIAQEFQRYGLSA